MACSKRFSLCSLVFGIVLAISLVSCGGGGGSDNPGAMVIGASYQGGKIVHIFEDGETGYVTGEVHGLIVSTNDLGNIEWATNGFYGDDVSGLSTAVGAGPANTAAIVAQNGTGTTYAAGLADSYTGGGYTDWYLPSNGEAAYLIDNCTAIGGLTNGDYWTSNGSYELAHIFNPVTGAETNNYKYYTNRVRAFRNF